MKKAFLLGIVALAAFSISSCQKEKGKDSAQIAQEALATIQKDTTQVADAPAAAEVSKGKSAESDSIVSEIASIEAEWMGDVLNVADHEAGIKKYMALFCAAHPEFKGNELMLRYLADEAGYNAETSGYVVEVNESADFLKCASGDQHPSLTVGSVWKRNNGTKLLGVLMEKTQESGESEHLLVFYDFDPEHLQLVPNLNLTNAAKQAMDCIRGDYTVQIVNGARNIELVQFDEKDGEKYFLLRWDGTTFKFDPMARSRRG